MFITCMSKIQRGTRDLNCKPSPPILNFRYYSSGLICMLFYKPDNSLITCLLLHLWKLSPSFELWTLSRYFKNDCHLLALRVNFFMSPGTRFSVITSGYYSFMYYCQQQRKCNHL
jgi:hypothetical protein